MSSVPSERTILQGIFSLVCLPWMHLLFAAFYEGKVVPAVIWGRCWIQRILSSWVLWAPQSLTSKPHAHVASHPMCFCLSTGWMRRICRSYLSNFRKFLNCPLEAIPGAWLLMFWGQPLLQPLALVYVFQPIPYSSYRKISCLLGVGERGTCV